MNDGYYYIVEDGNAVTYHEDGHHGPFLAFCYRDAKELRDTLLSTGRRVSVAQIGTVEGETFEDWINEFLPHERCDCFFLFRRNENDVLEYAAYTISELCA